jgi:hypothetical protein
MPSIALRAKVPSERLVQLEALTAVPTVLLAES